MASAPGQHVTAHDGTVNNSSSLPTSLKKQAAATGEVLAERIASVDQNITTKLRDGTAAIADKVSGAASAVADAAAATYTTLEDGVKVSSQQICCLMPNLAGDDIIADITDAMACNVCWKCRGLCKMVRWAACHVHHHERPL
jgi:Flp pilus assembly protein TadG